jgi:hypothetical protein
MVAGLSVTIGRQLNVFKRLKALRVGRFYRFRESGVRIFTFIIGNQLKVSRINMLFGNSLSTLVKAMS